MCFIASASIFNIFRIWYCKFDNEEKIVLQICISIIVKLMKRHLSFL